MNNNDSCLQLKHHKKILEAAILIVLAFSASHFPQKRGVKKEYRSENVTIIDTNGSYTKHSATWSLARCMLKLPLSSAGSVSQEQFQLLSGQ